ncbi:formate C-acetyltransferase [Methylocella silvestris]|uniref:Formate acetyltransferase n=1 Tax=Methylocella silvestris TaxID=199596 RepID=A0A2J7TJ15_METSI|nr:formate C-acetyltransferase [Methylocella silvestris]PNG26762.1 formate C-acetyltransferase [Methylocella silvestris]
MQAAQSLSQAPLDPWRAFEPGIWTHRIDVRDFLVKNVTPYEGDETFLVGTTARTRAVWAALQPYFRAEAKSGVLDADPNTPSTLTAHAPGYIDKANEVIVGLQTDKPFRRAIMPWGGLRMVENGLRSIGTEVSPAVAETFSKYRKTHNDGVFDVYTPEILACRKSHIITGLPDSYGRGRIIGDYRRVALYGVARLLEVKAGERAEINDEWPSDDIIRLREELADQIRALHDLVTMAKSYGFDLLRPAETATEAVQWTYFAYLGAIKEANGAAMSVGRISSFLDIYIERDLKEGRLDESGAQELIDQLVQKLRIVRFLRTPEYDSLFSGDPYWATESIGGMDLDGRTLVTRSSFRILQTLRNLGAAPEPNLTVLWSRRLPQPFKRFCIAISRDTSSLQYENDDLMRPFHGDDYGVACCVSAMRIGKQMQFFGARVNLGKCLLYAINGGRDEMSGEQIAPPAPAVIGDFLVFDDVMAKFDSMMEWLARTYVHAMNCIHYMHDKYFYERLEMALHDRDVLRTMAFGIAGLSVAADSLSAIKYAKVAMVRNDSGIVEDYRIEGAFPKFGNNDDRVDAIAADLVSRFMAKLRKHPTYRGATHTQSVLTITSNVVYGKATGNTPDGRRAGEPFAPGANPMHGRDQIGWLASCLSVAKLPYADAQDGVSYTVSVVPTLTRFNEQEGLDRAAGIFDLYFGQGGYHMNLNVVSKETLLDAMENPDKYPQLTIRVSGYAVNFVRLTREQQLDVIHRTFHQTV